MFWLVILFPCFVLKQDLTLLTDGRLVKVLVSKETVSNNNYYALSTGKQKTQLMLDFQYIPLNN